MEEWLSALRSAAPRRHTSTGHGQAPTSTAPPTTAAPPTSADDAAVDEMVSAEHRWYATSHARPTYCNVCRDALAGVTSHGLSCEVCKFKSHKRCAARAPPTCKWSTLASLGNDIVEDPDGSIIMPHQWIEGNLPVSAKCAICDKTCGSVLRLQDFRCLWCRWCVHAVCRPGWRARCTLGSTRVSLLPPTALNGRGADGAWSPPKLPPIPVHLQTSAAVAASSPILVFVNSKSGDNQGVKFLRRFKQLLNPMQVFELGGVTGGPRGALRLFRHFRPLRVLVCSGDGSVGWVLSEIDRLNMHNQCQVAVLPLGTGNDLARVLGWGAACDDGTNLLQLLERYEKASTKMLDRWSIMSFERPLPAPPNPPAPPDPPDSDPSAAQQGTASSSFVHASLETVALYEDTILWHLQNIVQSNDNTLIVRSARALSQTIRDFISRVTAETATSAEISGSGELGASCTVLKMKLSLLLDALKDEFNADDRLSGSEPTSTDHSDSCTPFLPHEDNAVETISVPRPTTPSTPSESLFEKGSREKTEKNQLNAAQVLKVRRAAGGVEGAIMGEVVFGRADSVRRAMHRVIHGTHSNCQPDTLLKPISSVNESRSPSPAVTAPDGELLLQLPAPRAFADGSRRSSAASDAPVPLERDHIPDVDEDLAKLLCSNQDQELTVNSVVRLLPAQEESIIGPTKSDRLGFLDVSSNLTCVDTGSCTNLIKYKDKPVSRSPPDGGNVNIPNFIISDTSVESQVYESEQLTIIDVDRPYTEDQHFQELEENLSRKSHENLNNELEEKDLSDALSAISNEDFSLNSDINDNKSFQGLTQLEDDMNGYIGHIDSPETSDTTCLNSETIHGESIMDDISSMLGQEVLLAMMGKNGENEYTDETTIITSDTVSEIPLDSRNPSLEKYDDSKIRFLAKRCKVKEVEEKFGFENRVFNLETAIAKTDKNELVEPVKYCSLAQFVEGNDIARRSFKRHMRQSKKLEKKEKINRHSIVDEELEVTYTESGVNASDTQCNSNFEKTEVVPTVVDKDELKIKLNEATKPESTTLNFPQVCVVVEPPSPSLSEENKSDRVKNLNSRTANVLSEFFDQKADSLSVKSVEVESNGNLNRERRLSDQNPNLLSLDPEYDKFLRCSPAATRRISCGSLYKQGENDRISTSTSSVWRGSTFGLNAVAKEKDALDKSKKLPIINPLVQLPAWPHVTGIVSQCLLANADALCAAASPLMDPDETIMEGFFERSVMNNYFGIGIDAKISLDFHNKREEHPEKCRSRARNYMWYGVLGSKEWLHKTYRHLGQRVQLECDGQRIPLPELQGIVVLNIPSFMGGTNFWGGTRADDIFLAPSFDDRILEVVAVFGSAQMAASRLINLQKHRIAQCRVVQINILGNEGVPVQVDGEAWLQPPGCIRIIHKNRVQMLGRSRALETSLKTWNEIQQQKQSALLNVGDTPLSAAPPSPALPGQLAKREAAQLISLLDAANSLVKWVKISAISERNGAGGPTHCWGDTATLYARARGVSARLDALQDSEGALVRGPELRRRIAELVRDTGDLCDSVSSVVQSSPIPLTAPPSPLDMRQAMQYVTALRVHIASVTVENSLAYFHGDAEPQKKPPPQQKVSWLRSRKSVAEATPLTPQAPSTAAQVKQWSQTDVGEWLVTLELTEYVESFAKNDITGRELLTLARRDLRDLGVTKVGHVKRLQHAIKEMH